MTSAAVAPVARHTARTITANRRARIRAMLREVHDRMAASLSAAMAQVSEEEYEEWVDQQCRRNPNM